MSLSAGERLGPYEILAPIGKGGMGELYRAIDTRLHRDVAIKVLPHAFATEAARERFQREARAASALNHPKICSIYDIGDRAVHPFLVMELLTGTTLRDRIGGTPLEIALAALNGGKPGKAREALEPARRYELAMNGLSNLAFCSALYPAWVRGEALLAEHKGAEAAAEFQKLIDHRRIVLGDPAGTVAVLEVGRAWASAGDNGKAKAAYQDFLTRWEDADSDIPILKQARLEFATLQ